CDLRCCWHLASACVATSFIGRWPIRQTQTSPHTRSSARTAWRASASAPCLARTSTSTSPADPTLRAALSSRSTPDRKCEAKRPELRKDRPHAVQNDTREDHIRLDVLDCSEHDDSHTDDHAHPAKRGGVAVTAGREPEESERRAPQQD